MVIVQFMSIIGCIIDNIVGRTAKTSDISVVIPVRNALTVTATLNQSRFFFDANIQNGDSQEKNVCHLLLDNWHVVHGSQFG